MTKTEQTRITMTKLNAKSQSRFSPGVWSAVRFHASGTYGVMQGDCGALATVLGKYEKGHDAHN